jgi:predicted house-cleaning noncanonical NTP pyrophosphatase (MazG superfamily)
MKSLKVMSRYLIILTLLVFGKDILAQVKIGNNPKVMLPGALLELEHDSKALVITRVTTTQMNAIQANEGMLVYNTTDSCIYQRTSTAWKSLCSGANITSQNLTNGRGIIVMDGTGAVLKATSLRIDSSEIAKMMGERPIIDTLAKLIGRAPIKDSIVKVLKDSISTIIQNGNITGKNAQGSEIIKVNGGTGAVLKDMTITVDTAKMMTLISNNLNKSPLKDSLSTSITNIINNNGVTGKNMTSGTLVTLSGTPTGSLLKDVNIDINTTKMKDSIASWINDKPISDSITKYVSNDATIIKTLKDSVIKEITNGTVTGKNATQGSLITVTGGTGAVLKDMKVEADTVAMKTFIANNLNKSPMKDSITKLMKDSISTIISSGSVSGKNATQGSLITVTGGTGAVLKDMKVEADTVAMKTFIANNLNKSPMKDSITKLMKDSISTIISSGSVTGKNATQGSLITVTGGTGAVLKDMKVEADTNAMKTFIANNLNKSPMKDSITKLMKDSISTIISNGSVTGKNTTAGSLITVTGGTGSALKDNSIAVDTAAMKTFIANNLNSSPIKDSLGSSITNIINNNGVTGKDITNGNGIIVTGGAGAALKATSLRIDSTAIAKMINQSPVKDSVTKLMRDSISSIITNGGVTGKNATQGSLITVTGGTGAVLKDMKVEADTNAMKTFIANNLNSSPIKDSLGSSITNIINNNGVTGKDITNGNGIIVTGGAGAALKATSLRIDSTAIAKMINQSPVKDSVTKLMRDSISSIITNGGVTGKNATQGSLITVTGGTGAVLKDMKVEADTNAMKTFIANNLNKSPMKDSITKLMKDSISTIISNGSVTGKNTTAGSLITVTGGTGSALKDNSIAVDTAAMKTFIANNLNSSPIKDSLGSSITNIINNNGVTGKDITNGNGIIVTGGAGAALKATSLRIDSTAIAKMINQSPVKDSVTKLMRDSISSIITNGSINGKALTGVGINVSANGSTSLLKDVTITWDSTAVYSKIKADSVAITNMIVAAGSIDLDKDSTNEIQKLTFSNNVVKLSKGGDSVNLAGLITDTTSLSNRINTNKQAIIDTATSLRALVNAHITADLDIDSTNEIQKLSLSGNVIKLSKNGDSVSIAAFKNMAKNGTSISGDSVVLGGTLDRATTITTSATNTLTLAGLQSGASTDSIMTDSAGVVRHRSITTLKKEKVVVFTSNYTVLADDEILIYRGTGPTGTHTLTLPSAAANKDRVLQIVNMGRGDDIDLNLSTSVLTIGGGTDITETFIRNTVSGAGYGAGASFGNTMKIVSDGTQWIKIGL